MNKCKNGCGRTVDKDDNTVKFRKNNIGKKIIKGKVCAVYYFKLETRENYL